LFLNANLYFFCITGGVVVVVVVVEVVEVEVIAKDVNSAVGVVFSSSDISVVKALGVVKIRVSET
jgi:hypothetical protein